MITTPWLNPSVPFPECALVIKVAGSYMPLHQLRHYWVILPGGISSDLRVAQASARAFADQNHIRFEPHICITGRPIMAVCQQQMEKWKVVELDIENWRVVSNEDITWEQAYNLAFGIAMLTNNFFFNSYLYVVPEPDAPSSSL